MKKSDYSDVKNLSKENIPSGEEGARMAVRVRQYIMAKNRLIKRFTVAFSACLLALLVFIIIARGTSLYDDYAEVFWPVAGVLAAAAAACFATVVVNMVQFKKFLKKFD